MANNKKQNKPQPKGRGVKVYNYSKPKNLKKQPVPSQKIDNSKRITLWETATENNKNNFPQQLLQDIQGSPVANAALEVWYEFVRGGGFVEDIGDEKVNNKQTLDDLNANVAQDLTYLWGCSVLVLYNLEGQPIKYKHFPFESVRLGEIGEQGEIKDIKYNPYFGIPSSYDDKYTQWFYPFNSDPEFVRNQIAAHNKALKDDQRKDITDPYPGQMFWFSIETPLHRVYPQPFYYSAINWFRIDRSIQEFHERNINNNFLLSVIMNVPGSPDDQAGRKDENGDFVETLGEVMDRQMREFAQSDGSVLINYFRNEQEKASIEAFPTNSNHDLFIALQNLTDQQIAIGTKVPQILISISQQGKLGETQEILNAVRLMQSRTKDLRGYLSAVYQDLFKDSDKFLDDTTFEIANVNPDSFLPDWVVNSLTEQEKRQYIASNFGLDLSLSNESGPDVRVTEDDEPQLNVL